MLAPGPDHPITITRNPNSVRVIFAGRTVAESANALRLQESDYPAVFYFPRGDVGMEFLMPTQYSTRCPYKGQASHFTLTVAGRESQNAVWSYEKPYPAVHEIAGHLAFYRNRVDAISEF